MADEDKKEEKEEKEEGEEKDEEGEEDDEDDMMEDGDGDDFDAKAAKNFPPQAREWSMTHFGTPEKASLWQFAEKRSAEDIEQMDRRRKWQVEIRNVRYTNLDEISDVFVQFQIGYDFKLKKKFDRPRAGGSKSKGKPKREYTWVETGTQGQTLLTNVVRNVDVNSDATFASRFKTTWSGSYFDLYQKMLHLEVWDWNKMASNNFIAEDNVTLVSIARGSMTQSVDVFGEFVEPGKKRKVKRQVGQLSFVCIFQEVVTFDIKFLDWEASLRSEALDAQDEKDVSEISYTTVAVFDLNKRTRGLFGGRALHRTSRADRQAPGAVDTVRAHYSVPGTMTLRGIRNDIEDSVLDVTIMEQSSLGLRRREACFTRIPLKGVTISGFMQSQMGYYYTFDALKSNGGRETRKELKQAGDIKGQVDVSVPAAPLWKEFTQVGDLNPPELRDYAPYNYTYLAVKVIRANDLASADETGLSDPFIVVEWGGQRSETVPKMQTLDPVFNETSYFHVRSYQEFPAASDLAKHPYVTITAWDYDESGVSENLGSAKLYLHSITGSERDGRVVSQVPLSRIKVNRRKSWWNPRLAEFEARTRVFRGRLSLTHKDPMVKSTVQVEAWFRGPPQQNSNIVDMMEREDRRRRLYGDLLLLPHYDQEAENREKVLCLCFTGKDVNGMRKVCESSQSSTCDSVRLFENDVKARGSDMGMAVLDIATSKTPYNALVARPDNELVLRALPTYVQVLVPPKDMFSPEDTQYMAREEARYRPNTAHSVFDYVCTMEFAEGRGVDGAETDGPEHLVSPNFLLDSRRGLYKDHVLLLCNLFLGIGLDAYVCIGTAVRRKRSDPTQTEEVEHWWVMTREDHNACVGEAEDDWYTKGGAVRFYDVLTQRVVSLRGRWDGQNPDNWGKGLAKRKKKKKVVVEEEKAGDNDALPVLEDGNDDEELDEDDILQMVASQEDTAVQVTSIFLDGAGMGDGWGQTPQHMLMRAQELEREREREAGAEAERKAKEEELAKMKATPAYKHRIAELDRLLTTEPVPSMPYRSIHAAFNPKNLWVNITRKKQSPIWDPARLTYDFERGFDDFAWMPLVHPASREIGAAPVAFYPVRGLSSRMSEDRVEELQRGILDELDSGIVNVRNAMNMRTRMAPALVSPIQDVLIAKQELHLVAHTKENGWDFENHAWVKDTKLRGYRAVVRYKQALHKLATTTPPQHGFRIGFCRVNATDPTHVRKTVLKHHWGKTRRRPHIHAEEHDGKEMFAIGVKVFPFFNQIATCRVCIMVVFPTGEE